MMRNSKYSAGAVSKGFWHGEFRKYLELSQEGKVAEEIKELQENENILLAPSPSYGKRMISEIAKRVNSIPEEIIDLFFNLSISDQKLINLLGIMLTDRLFFEYIYEVYREALILGTQNFEDSNIRIFFKNKSEQSEKVAQYTVDTKRRLGTAYKTYIKEANLIKEEKGILMYNRIIMDLRLEEKMKDSSLTPYLKALTGVQS